ncbi:MULTISPECIES: hypothetical protein [Microbulbifer]|uniref:hypothetical protein n=1 Tax=Microbulbifer TaxID=48073 RepID=UPI001596BC2B|nr:MULTISPECIES: hypothetical protein [Microbulbifer]
MSEELIVARFAQYPGQKWHATRVANRYAIDAGARINTAGIIVAGPVRERLGNAILAD